MTFHCDNQTKGTYRSDAYQRSITLFIVMRYAHYFAEGLFLPHWLEFQF